MRNLIIADRQDIIRLGIRHLADSIRQIKEIIEIEDKRQLITTLSQCTNSIVLVDYTNFDFKSVDELIILRSRFPDTNWILFSEELSDSILRQLVYNDVTFSIVFKSDSLEEIHTALSVTLQGTSYICQQVTNHLSNPHPTLDKDTQLLTQSETSILREIALGKSTKEIAADRNLSVHTIITHRKNIFRKLEVNTVYEATKYAVRAGIIDIADYYI